jgi:hypothetical protein
MCINFKINNKNQIKIKRQNYANPEVSIIQRMVLGMTYKAFMHIMQMIIVKYAILNLFNLW